MYQCLETSSVVTAWRVEWATGIEWAESRVATTRGKMQKRAIPQQRIIAFKQSIVPKMRSPALCIKIERVDSFPCSWWFPNIIIEIIIPLLLPLMCMLSRFSQGQLFATAWTAAWQPPLGMGFSRQEYWSGLPFPSPGDLPETGQVVCYSHLLKNFPQFVVIHTVKGFSIVNEAEGEVFLEFFCFFLWVNRWNT